MKLKVLILSGTLIAAVTSYSQKNIDVIDDAKVVFAGMDYTQSKLVGSERSDFTDAEDIRDRIVAGWHDKVYDERDKYDFEGALDIDDLEYNIEPMIDYNESNIELEGWVQPKEYSLSKEKAINHVENDLDFSKYEADYAVLLVCEMLNKPEEKGSFYFMIVDVSDEDVVVSEKYVGKPGGFGITNYWLRPIYETYKQLKKDVKRWR